MEVREERSQMSQFNWEVERGGEKEERILSSSILALSLFLALTNTLYPSLRNLNVASYPIPLLAPVISTLFPFSAPGYISSEGAIVYVIVEGINEGINRGDPNIARRPMSWVDENKGNSNEFTADRTMDRRVATNMNLVNVMRIVFGLIW